MSCNWRNLNFGIEIELTFITRKQAANILSDFFNTSYYCVSSSKYEIEDYYGRTWQVVYDRSIKPQKKQNGRIINGDDDYKTEIVSPILVYGDATDNEADIKILQSLIRTLRKNGAGVNSSTGIHIHVDASRFEANINSLRVLCNMVYSKQNLLERAINTDEDRKRYCKLLSTDFIEKLNKIKPKTKKAFADIHYGFDTEKPGYQSFRTIKYHESRYKILNLHPFLSNSRCAIEFRIFNSSTHSGRVKAYIQFCLLLTATSQNQSRANYKETVTDNPKFSFRIFLIKLGAIGKEFSTCRYHMLKLLEGNGAWRYRSKEEITF